MVDDLSKSEELDIVLRQEAAFYVQGSVQCYCTVSSNGWLPVDLLLSNSGSTFRLLFSVQVISLHFLASLVRSDPRVN